MAIASCIMAMPSLALCGVGPAPMRLAEAEKSLVGAASGRDALRAAAAHAGAIEAMGDVHASKKFRQQLAATLTERALVTAFDRAMRIGA